MMKRKYIYLVLCFFCMAMIFWFSHQQGVASQSTSDFVIEKIDQLLHTHIMTQGGWLLTTISFIVRKIAHMSEYAVLTILYVLCMRSFGCKHYYVWAIVACFLYASSDEFHQLFVVGRSGQFSDVLIDTLGGSIGVLIHKGCTMLYSAIRIRGK